MQRALQQWGYAGALSVARIPLPQMQRTQSPCSHKCGNGAKHRSFATARSDKRRPDHSPLRKPEVSGCCRGVRRKVGKPVLATESCWGSLDDGERARIVATELSELRDRNLAFLAHVLHHSLVADCHRPKYGPVSGAGYMAFIEQDGSLRPHHDIFNTFV